MAEFDSTPPVRTDDPISAPLRDVLAIFSGELKDVRFPDIDAAVLAKAVAAVEQAHDEVRRIEAALDDAKRRLEDAQDALLHKAQRGVAYARVYAIDVETDLLARLDAITLPRTRASKTPTTTALPEAPRRRRKGTAASDTLFSVPAAEDVAVERGEGLRGVVSADAVRAAQ